jgi:hypothetical protein
MCCIVDNCSNSTQNYTCQVNETCDKIVSCKGKYRNIELIQTHKTEVVVIMCMCLKQTE